LAVGLTLDEVAARMTPLGQPITKAGLSKYEKGKSIPNQTFLVQLARVLGVKASFFVSEPAVSIEWLAFRKLSKLRKGRQEQIKAYAQRVVEGQIWLRGVFHPEERPNFPHPHPARTVEDAEAAAQGLRQEWGLDELPIDSLTSTFEDRGGIVVPNPHRDREFDGLAGWANKDTPVAVVNLGVPDDRRRYNLAHELGHLAMDCDDLGEKEEEKLAHRFAAAFLVPAPVARRELGTRRRRLEVRELGLLKRKYGLSMQAWARRALDLSIIEQPTYRNVCIEFSRNGWRKAEPFDFCGHEMPSRLEQMTLRALAEGIITRERAEELCPGCTANVQSTEAVMPGVGLSPAELRKLSREQRQAILEAAATLAEAEYRSDAEMTDYEAFSEEDLNGNESEPLSR